MVPWLLPSGAGALGWWRIRGTSLAATPAGADLHQAYRWHTLSAARHQLAIADVITRLRERGIEPLLIKGWAAARLYAEPGLRPFGDIDLCVPASTSAAAAALVSQPGGPIVDLHHDELGAIEGGLAALQATSLRVTLGAIEARIPGPEQHLRLTCLHLLKHGAWRPLWLCDVGAALDRRPANFDWDLLLGRDRTRAGWIATTLRLAEALLGASLEGAPARIRKQRLPRWLLPAVLDRWRLPSPGDHAHEVFRRAWSNPRRWPAAFRARWPDPITTTLQMRARFDELPRLPLQLASYAMTCVLHLVRLARGQA